MRVASVANLPLALLFGSLLVACSGLVDAPVRAGTSGAAAGVLCDVSHRVFNDSASVRAFSEAQWRCEGDFRVLTANGLPDHPVGNFPNTGNPNPIRAQTVSARLPLRPQLAAQATRLGGPRGATGYLLNGVKIDADTNGGCDDSGTSCSLAASNGRWRLEALGQSSFNFGEDENRAHVQPSGAYHYHGIPEAYLKRLGKGEAMTLMGWAADGFPIYARYGLSKAEDAGSALRVVRPSYALKAEPDAGRPAVSVYPMGVFAQDYAYQAGSGDLDECNGRYGVTPEFPKGTYHYYATDSYPFLQRCVKGRVPERPASDGAGRGAARGPERAEGRDAERGRPSPQAREACQGLSAGAVCRFEEASVARQGSCWAPEGRPLACRADRTLFQR